MKNTVAIVQTNLISLLMQSEYDGLFTKNFPISYTF